MPTTRDLAITFAAPLLRDAARDFAFEPEAIRTVTAVTEVVIEGTKAAFFTHPVGALDVAERECIVMTDPCGCRWYLCGPHVVAFLSCGNDLRRDKGGRRRAYAMLAPTVLN